MSKEFVLGISCFYHDSAAVLIRNGEIVSAVQEERFSRKKHDSRFPKNAIKYCLESNNIDLRDIKNFFNNDSLLFYDEQLFCMTNQILFHF